MDAECATTSGGSGERNDESPSQSNFFFDFHAVSAKIMPSNRLALPFGVGCHLYEILDLPLTIY